MSELGNGYKQLVGEYLNAEELVIKSQLLDMVFDIIFATDLEGNIIYANEATCKYHGYAYKELIQMNLKDLDTNESAELVKSRITVLLKNGTLTFQTSHYREDKTIIPLEVHTKVVAVNGKKIVAVFCKNLVEHQKVIEDCDSSFIEQLKQAMAQAKRENSNLALVYIGLDRFKNINDTLGNRTGDWLLFGVNKTLTNILDKNELIIHTVGDKFMLLLPNAKSQDDIERVCKRVLAAFETPFYLHDFDVYITASIGITVYPKDGKNVETLMRNVDIAMHEVKRNGGSDYKFYTLALNQQSAKKFELENWLCRALNCNEFELYYQPQVDIGNGHIKGVEALLRWRHPYFGFVPPSEFIPLAEASGHIVPIGEWVLRIACAQNKAWLDQGLRPSITVSVNISLKQLQHRNFFAMVANVLEETGLPPHLLELEITESVSAHNSKYMYKIIKKVANLGVKISLDDFGTDYSSLLNLKNFPINTLKIDRSFVKEIAIDSRSEAIIIATIALAKNLKLKVIAEGVETEEQLAFLKRENCGEIQGYLFSRPLPLEQINNLLFNRR